MDTPDRNGICDLALIVNAKVPEFYDQPFTKYCSSKLFSEVINGTYNVDTAHLHIKALYQDAFGLLPVADVGEVVANLDHRKTNSAENGVAIVITLLTLVVVGLRLYSRIVLLTGRLRLDDWLIILGTILAIGVQACNWIGISEAGFGKHYWDVSQKETVVALKINLIINILFNVAMMIVKLAFLIFYRTLSNARGFQWACLGLGAIISAGTVSLVFATIFSCIPVNIWDHSAEIWDSCTNIAARVFFQAGFSIVTDIAILALPLSVISNLKVIDRREKFALMGFFLVGGLVCIVSIVRTLQVDPYERSPDWTWYGPMFMFWHVVEVDLAIMVNSAPAIKPLLMSEVNRVRDLVSTTRSRAAPDDLEDARPMRPTMPRRVSTRQAPHLRQNGVRELDEGRWTPRPISDVSMMAVSPLPAIPDGAPARSSR